MRSSLAVPVVLGLVLLLGGCTVIDLKLAPSGVHSDHAFITGYADAGWPATDSLFKVGLFKGPSQGSLLYLQIWKLLRLELGFLGLAAGIGPLDAGFGVLFYDPHPPAYVDCDECDEDCEEHDHGHDMHDDEHDDDHAAGEAEGEGDSVQTFVYYPF